MRIPTKGQYAVTAMLDIALHDNERPVSLSEISGRLDISISYLEQLFSKLRSNDLVASVRGPGGGYRLSREPSQISVMDILNALNDKSEAVNSGNNAHQLWLSISHQMQDFLDDISLANVLDNKI